jgi:3-oxoacyl-[acyl-carrier protein] reductase
MLNFTGKVALVTGGSRGIGRAVGVLLGSLGAHVALGYARDEDAARDAEAAVKAAGGQARAIKADLGATGEAERLVALAEESLGPLDVLVVNHGIWKHAPIESMTGEDWDETLRVNLSSARALCGEASRRMATRGSGAIVVVASTAGQRGEAEYSHYAATKGGLMALAKSLAKELGPRGIRVNAVAPGWVVTDMTREALETPRGKAAVEAIPLCRAARPEEIAGPIVFLASDLASYVQGHVLSVNGGSVMVG